MYPLIHKKKVYKRVLLKYWPIYQIKVFVNSQRIQGRWHDSVYPVLLVKIFSHRHGKRPSWHVHFVDLLLSIVWYSFNCIRCGSVKFETLSIYIRPESSFFRNNSSIFNPTKKFPPHPKFLVVSLLHPHPIRPVPPSVRETERRDRTEKEDEGQCQWVLF